MPENNPTAQDQQIQAILEDKRFAWEIVNAWLEANGYVLVKEAEEYQRLARMLPHLPILETYENLKKAR